MPSTNWSSHQWCLNLPTVPAQHLGAHEHHPEQLGTGNVGKKLASPQTFPQPDFEIRGLSQQENQMRIKLKCIYLTEKSREVVTNEHETFIEVPVNRGLATQPFLH